MTSTLTQHGEVETFDETCNEIGLNEIGLNDTCTLTEEGENALIERSILEKQAGKILLTYSVRRDQPAFFTFTKPQGDYMGDFVWVSFSRGEPTIPQRAKNVVLPNEAFILAAEKWAAMNPVKLPKMELKSLIADSRLLAAAEAMIAALNAGEDIPTSNMFDTLEELQDAVAEVKGDTK